MNLIDEIDNACGDAYEVAVPANGAAAALECAPLGPGHGGGVHPARAGALPMHSLEPFLLLLSSVFVPLFGVMLGRLAFDVRTADLLAQAPRAHALPIALWLAGIAFFHLVPRFAPALGSALPTLVLCFVLAYAAQARVQSGAHVGNAGV